MKIRKSDAFIMSLVSILLIDGIAILRGFDASAGSLTAIVTLTIGFIGAGVADNGVKGKFYRPELDKEARCPDGEGK